MFLEHTAAQYAQFAKALRPVLGLDSLTPEQTEELTKLFKLVNLMVALAGAKKAAEQLPLHRASLKAVLAHRLHNVNGSAQLAQGIDQLHACLEQDGYQIQSMIVELRGVLEDTADGGEPAALALLTKLLQEPRRHPDGLATAEPQPAEA